MKKLLKKLANKILRKYGFEDKRTVAIFKIAEFLPR
jgi:hypothetical protein